MQLAIQFVYAIPVRGATVRHGGDRIDISYPAGAACDIVFRSNIEGDIALPIARIGAVSFRVRSRGGAPLSLRIRVRGAGWLGAHTELFQQATLPANGETALVLDSRKFRLCQRELNADHLRWDWTADAPGEITLLGIELHELTAEQFFAPGVDRYGQHQDGAWPEKVRDEADLRADASSPSPPPLPGRDAFGGWGDGPRFRNTGFFRLEQAGQQWWLVTPEGAPYLSFGPTCVSTGAANTLVQGREHLFAELPPRDGAYADAWISRPGRRAADPELYPERAYGTGDEVVSFYTANLIRKYGRDWRARWAEETVARLRSWGMNTLANWSDVDFARRVRMPYVLQADREAVPDFSGLMRGPDAGPFPLHQTPDAFHPQFSPRIRSAFSALASYADDPCLLGYFVQNEEAWCAWKSPFALPLHWESRRVFIDGLREGYGTIEKLNAAWSARYRSFAELGAYQNEENPPGLTAQGVADCDAFLRRFADRYFGEVRAALQQADPHHLFWGCRFLALPPHPAVLQGAAPHMDIVSVNWYLWHKQSVADVEPFLGEWHRLTAKPLAITEYSFDLTDERMLAGRFLSPSRDRRAAQSRQFTESCLALPFVLGCHWFQFIDEMLTGRDLDGERQGLGLVDVADRPHAELVSALQTAAEGMYRRHGTTAAQP